VSTHTNALSVMELEMIQSATKSAGSVMGTANCAMRAGKVLVIASVRSAKTLSIVITINRR